MLHAHPSLLQRLFVPIPAEYQAEFTRTVFLENANRLIIGCTVITILESVVLIWEALTNFSAPAVWITQVGIVVFNLFMVPVVWYWRRRVRQHQSPPPQGLIELTFGTYVAWACGIVLAIAASKLVGDVHTQVYTVGVYGTAVFLLVRPRWSLFVYTSAFLVYTSTVSYLLTGSPLVIRAHTWNALALNLVAWIIARLLFQLRLQTFISQYKSETLLRNILPEQVVQELQETGHTVPERFGQVTVLLSDLVEFTQQSSRLTPQQLIAELNDLFTAFDTIVERYGCERIKTIGDAYLCVCGMPKPNPRHAHQIMQVAMEIVAYLEQRNQGHPIQWQIRVGVHSGEVVGGVVGVKKYIYDIFGDTVNTASRMQSHSAPMEVNISEVTYALVKDDFEFKSRGPSVVKGKGDLEMYFLVRPSVWEKPLQQAGDERNKA
jgi:class 3 adenylate cyclase